MLSLVAYSTIPRTVRLWLEPGSVLRVARSSSSVPLPFPPPFPPLVAAATDVIMESPVRAYVPFTAKRPAVRPAEVGGIWGSPESEGAVPW